MTINTSAIGQDGGGIKKPKQGVPPKDTKGMKATGKTVADKGYKMKKEMPPTDAQVKAKPKTNPAKGGPKVESKPTAANKPVASKRAKRAAEPTKKNTKSPTKK